MAEKHKSKWKAPKDEAKSQKPEARKDLKDYTAPDAHGMVPNLVSGVQPLVARKYATEDYIKKLKKVNILQNKPLKYLKNYKLPIPMGS